MARTHRGRDVGDDERLQEVVLRFVVERADEEVGALFDGIANEAMDALRRSRAEESASLGAVGRELELVGEGDDALGEGVGDRRMDENVVARLADLTAGRM